MKAGDRVVTSSGRTGVLKQSTVNMPHHYLIQFDSGELHWIVKHAVRPSSKAVSKKRKTTKSKSKKPVDNLLILSYGCKLVQPNCIGLLAE
jgi:hypothetical protein